MPLQPLQIFNQGVVRENRVSRQAIKKSYNRSFRLAYNCDLRQKTGSVKPRKGSRKIGSSNPSTSTTPLGAGVLDSIAYNRPFGVWEESGNAVLKYYDGANWQTASGFPTTSTEYDFAQLGGRIFAVGASTMYESDTLGTFTNQENRGCLQLEAKVVWVMGSRVFASQITNRPGYVQFSSIWNPAGYDAVSTKNITWDTDATAGDALIVNPDDGAGEVVGGVFSGNTYLIFKERATYMYRKAQTGVEPDAFLQVGAANKDAYTSCQGFAWMYSAPISKASGTESGGFYQTNGMNLRDVGWPIQDIIDSVSDPSKVRVESDMYSVYIYLGNVNIDDVAYTNAVMVYHVPSDSWEGPHSYLYNDMRMFRGATYGLMAQTEQKIVQLETDDSTDDGAFIEYDAQSNVQEITEEAYLKGLNMATVYTQKAKGSKIQFFVDKRNEPAGDNELAIDSDIHDEYNPVVSEFNTMRWRWSGIKEHKDTSLEGILLDYTQKGTK